MTYDSAPLLRQLLLTVPARPGPFGQHTGGNGGHDTLTRPLPSDEQLADALGVSKRQIQRWKKGAPLRLEAADRYAVMLGLHPSELWPEWFAEPCELRCVSCGAAYVVPVSSVSDKFEEARAVDWFNTHECEKAQGRLPV